MQGLGAAQHGAMAWKATRMMLFRGCWAVSEQPAVWVWKRSIRERGSSALKRSFMILAHRRRAARNLAISSRKSRVGVEEEGEPGPELVHFQPRGLMAAST